MAFIGSGKKYLEWTLVIGEKQILVWCFYRYVSFNFISLVTVRTWYEQDLETGEFKEIQYINLKNKYGDQTPKLGWYRSFALIAIPAIFGLIAAFVFYSITLIYPQISLK